MCGRFTLRTPANLIIEQFGAKLEDGLAGAWKPRYNVAPTQMFPVLLGPERLLRPMRWGLVPFWAKDPKQGARMINARSETVATKPAFRAAFKKRRCAVPADGYFEWVKQGKQKQPYWIRRQDERPFLMAGLWETWGPPADDLPQLETFTILTTAANSATAMVHDRMPVILDEDDYDRWLDPEVSQAEGVSDLFEPYDSEAIRVDAVSTRVNSVRNDDQQCVELVDDCR